MYTDSDYIPVGNWISYIGGLCYSAFKHIFTHVAQNWQVNLPISLVQHQKYSAYRKISRLQTLVVP